MTQYLRKSYFAVAPVITVHRQALFAESAA